MAFAGFNQIPGYQNVSYGEPSISIPVTDWGAIAQSSQIPADPYGSFGIDTAGIYGSVGDNLARNPLGQKQPGFVDYLNQISNILEQGADAYRAVKGIPARFGPEKEQRLAGEQFGKYLEDRRADREIRRREAKSNKIVPQDEKSFNLSILRKALSDPSSIAQLFGNTAVTPSIDPASLGVEMDTTPARQWRPQAPALPQ
jgi:hypothetical protein